MLKPYDLLENILIDIEKGIKERIDSNALADKYCMSEGHIRRLFRFAFNQPLARYIRSRKLSASLYDILKTDLNVIDIALDYGYSFEQTYIRAFKEEFGISPGEVRKTKPIIQVKPPLHLFNENNLKEGVLFGPDIVMVPQFFIAGNSNIIPFSEALDLAPKAAIHFWENDKEKIKGINTNIYIGLTCNMNMEAENSEYISSVQVSDLNGIPEGYRKFTFQSCLCARFRYIGKHHYYDLNRQIAEGMYKTIMNFGSDKNEKYALLDKKVFFERIDTECYDGTYCQMEWIAPVEEKNEMSEYDHLRLY